LSTRGARSARRRATAARFSKSIIIKDARSPERLLDEVTLFLHQWNRSCRPSGNACCKSPATATLLSKLAAYRRGGRCPQHLCAIEPAGAKGATIEIARNGREAIEALTRSRLPGANPIDLVLMDIMMPEMDGLTAMREIRKQSEWKKLPIIALNREGYEGRPGEMPVGRRIFAGRSGRRRRHHLPIAGVGFKAPMPPAMANHVAAVTVFGNPSARSGQR